MAKAVLAIPMKLYFWVGWLLLFWACIWQMRWRWGWFFQNHILTSPPFLYRNLANCAYNLFSRRFPNNQASFRSRAVSSQNCFKLMHALLIATSPTNLRPYSYCALLIIVSDIPRNSQKSKGMPASPAKRPVRLFERASRGDGQPYLPMAHKNMQYLINFYFALNIIRRLIIGPLRLSNILLL